MEKTREGAEKGRRGERKNGAVARKRCEGWWLAAAFRTAPRLPSLPNVAPSLIFPSPSFSQQVNVTSKGVAKPAPLRRVSAAYSSCLH